MELEKKYITTLLYKDSSPEMNISSLNWTKFLEIALDQGVANLVYFELRNKKTPAPIHSVFEKSYHHTLVLNLINMHAIEELEQPCQCEKIKVLTLKGASLLEHVYPKIGMRPMTDIDLMVHPSDLSRFEVLLNQLGYQKSSTLTHLFIKDHSTIDLHTHALNINRIPSRRYLFPQGMDVIWQKAVPWKPGFNWVKKPDDADNILLLSQHLMKHSFTRLIWLMDIYWLLKRFNNLDWLKLAERARLLQQEKPLFYALFLLGAYFDFHPPSGSGLEIRAGRLSSLEISILNNSMKGRRASRIGPLLSLFCIKTIEKRLQFVFENLFLNKEIVNKEFAETYGGKRQRLYPVRTLQAMMIVLRQVMTAFLLFFHIKR